MGTPLPGIVGNPTATIVTSPIPAQTGINWIISEQTSMNNSTTPLDNVAATSLTNQNITCVPVPNLYTISFQSFLIPSLVFNVLLFTAAMFDRMKLQRQNYLFASAISTLMSNILYMVMLEWILLDNYSEKPVHESVAGQLSFGKYVWVFEEAATVAMPFLICGNIVCLTYVTVNSATYVGRVANIEGTENSKRRFTKIRRVTGILIGTSWVVPCILTIFGMTSMNCVRDCICPSTNFKGDPCPNQTHCSKFWAPITTAYIWINVGLWTAAIVGLCTLVGCAIVKYERTTQRPTVQPITGEDNNNIQMSLMNRQEQGTTLQRSSRSFRHGLNTRLRFALILTILYVACSACFIAAIAVDTVLQDVSEFTIFGLSRITMYLYTTACPIVMVWHLPVLKTSLITLLHKIRHCCKKKCPKNNKL